MGLGISYYVLAFVAGPILYEIIKSIVKCVMNRQTGKEEG